MSYYVEAPHFGFKELPDRILVREDGAYGASKEHGEPIIDHWYVPEQAIAATLGPTDPRERGLIPHFWTGDWTLHVDTERLPERIDVTLPDQRGREVYSARVHRFVPERTCRYEPDYTGFTWWDENDVEHYEEDSASDECWSASCNKCGFTMIVGDEGWFNGWDDIKVWTDEDDTEHHGILLEPIFKFCPNCGAKVIG